MSNTEYSPFGPPLGKGDTIVIPRKFHQVLPGEMFAVWLGDGRLGIALVARSPMPDKRRSDALIYTFRYVAKTLDEIQLIAHSNTFVKEDACYIAVGGASLMQNGAWPYLGTLKSFDIADWPMPCMSTDVPNPYMVMPMSDTLWGDVDRRKRVKIEIARWFIESGKSNSSGLQWGAKLAIDQSWRGVCPRWKDPVCYPACFDPWETVLQNLNNPTYWEEKVRKLDTTSR